MASEESKYEIDRDIFSTALYIDGEYVETVRREDEIELLKEYITNPVILKTAKRTSKKEVVDGTGMLEAVQKASEGIKLSETIESTTQAFNKIKGNL